MGEERASGLAAPERNVGQGERWVSGVAGAALLVYGLRRARRRGRRRSTLLVPLGVGLLRRAVTGRCGVARFLGRTSVGDAGRSGWTAARRETDGTGYSHAVTIQRSREELFRFWRDFGNLPRFMDGLESVTVLDDRRSHWVAKGRLGARVEWDAEIEAELADELIAWRSVEGSVVEQTGSVRFFPAPGGGTQVRAFIRYAAPPGVADATAAQLRGHDPRRQVADDLRRFKQLMEGGDDSIPPAGTA